MADNAGADETRHFSGVYVRMAVQFLEEFHGDDVLRSILDRAGEARSLDTLLDDSAWASYDQIRSLFEAIASVLGSSESLVHAAASTAVGSGSSAELAQALQDVGSPDSLLETAVSMDSALGLSTIREREGERMGPGQWVLRERFTEGFEPFPEFCAFMSGLFSLIPTLFGLPGGNVVEEDCCCRGAEFCSYLITWSEGDRLTQERSYFETRAQLLRSRLETLQETVAEVISAPDPDAALHCVMEAASRALYAHSYILVTDPGLPMRQRLLVHGIHESEGRRIASELYTPEGRSAPGRLCVEVGTNDERFGWFAALDPGNRTFLDQEHRTIASYASLAAAALGSAAAVERTERALEEARREAATASSLLELSRDLAALTDPEQLAAHLAGAVRRVVDCDQSVVFLSGDEDVGVLAAEGFPQRVEAQLHGIHMPLAAMELLGPELTYLDGEDVAALSALYGFPADQIPVATVSVPMVANGRTLGSLVVSVLDGPERLRESHRLSDAMRGIAAQGAIALENALLVGRIRYQALHDGLTGLGNRTLMIERLDQALARARRENLAVAAMFIDLDGFKQINDTLGHSAGDELLSQLGARLQSVLRAGDSVGRIGGDEFVAVLEGHGFEGDPDEVAERLMKEVRRPFELGCVPGRELSVTASIGIAVGARQSADEMLRDADLALYRAKANGKDCHVIYSQEPVTTVRPSVTSGPVGTDRMDA